MTERYLEDFAVGQVYKSGRRRVDKEQIFAFAKEFDPQPYHLDEEAARNSPFQGLAASGWHTAAITMRLIVDGEFKPAGGILGVGFDDLSWPRAVRPGDESLCHQRNSRSAAVEIAARPRPDQGQDDDAQSERRNRAGLHRQSSRPPPSKSRIKKSNYKPYIGSPLRNAYSGDRRRRARRLFRRQAVGRRPRCDISGARAARRAACQNRPDHPQPARQRRPAGAADRHGRRIARAVRPDPVELQGL